MKKSIFLAALMLIAVGCLAQKKSVNTARNYCMSEENPKFEEARAAIKEALANDETKNLAETWYVAGLIGYRENYFDREILKSQDYIKRGQAIVESYDYWIKADEMAMTPIYDKKGKAKYNLALRKRIAEKMMEYYTSREVELVQYAIDLYNNQKNYDEAYKVFTRFLSIPDLEMMQDERYQEKLPKDTNYYYYQYLRARSAYENKDLDNALNLFRTLRDGNHNESSSAGQYLYQCYIDKGDSVTANSILDECIEMFPKEPWFLQNRINNLVRVGDADGAIAYLDRAIQMDPQSQYFNSKGSLLNMLKRFEEAIPVMQRALQMEPTNAGYNSNMGFIYFDRANKILDDASNLDNRGYKDAQTKAEIDFRAALPYFKKAYEIEPDNYQYKLSLRQLYYRLKMMDEYQALMN